MSLVQLQSCFRWLIFLWLPYQSPLCFPIFDCAPNRRYETSRSIQGAHPARHQQFRLHEVCGRVKRVCINFYLCLDNVLFCDGEAEWYFFPDIAYCLPWDTHLALVLIVPFCRFPLVLCVITFLYLLCLQQMASPGLPFVAGKGGILAKLVPFVQIILSLLQRGGYFFSPAIGLYSERLSYSPGRGGDAGWTVSAKFSAEVLATDRFIQLRSRALLLGHNTWDDRSFSFQSNRTQFSLSRIWKGGEGRANIAQGEFLNLRLYISGSDIP